MPQISIERVFQLMFPTITFGPTQATTLEIIMIKKIALSVILFGLTTAVAHAAPAAPSAPTAPLTQAATTQIAPNWGVKRQTVGFKRRGYRHRGFRRGGYGFRRGGYRGYRSYYGGRRFGYRRSFRNYGYGYRGYYGGSRVRGVGTVR
ncbi:MAG: hypothetical protein GY948_17060 [Alphaproteobacteria bacterium]|nr:hypothetical protein [Alphaproteobacteria bacterium]